MTESSKNENTFPQVKLAIFLLRSMYLGMLGRCHVQGVARREGVLLGVLGAMPLPQSTTLKNFKTVNTENVQKNNAFLAQFLVIFDAFLSFFARNFPDGVIIVPKMLERSPINFNSTRISDSGKTGS